MTERHWPMASMTDGVDDHVSMTSGVDVRVLLSLTSVVNDHVLLSLTGVGVDDRDRCWRLMTMDTRWYSDVDYWGHHRSCLSLIFTKSKNFRTRLKLMLLLFYFLFFRISQTFTTGNRYLAA